MAVKTFTSATLSSADTNTYLANSGLVYITQATVVGTPTTLTVDGCFTSAYENYRIVIKYATAAAGYPAVYINWRAGGSTAATATYAQMGTGRTSANADQSYGSSGQTNAYVGSLPGTMSFDVLSPANSAVQTTTYGQSVYYDGTNFATRTSGTFHNVTAVYDGFVLSAASSTFTTNLTVRIYGYRQS